MNCWNRCCCRAPCHTHKCVSLQLKWQHAEAHQGLNNSPAWREHTNGVKHTFQPSFPSPIIRNTQNPQPVDTTGRIILCVARQFLQQPGCVCCNDDGQLEAAYVAVTAQCTVPMPCMLLHNVYWCTMVCRTGPLGSLGGSRRQDANEVLPQSVDLE